MNKLFKVKTVGELVSRPGKFGTRGGVNIHWFRAGRTEPAVPYIDTIPCWDELVHSHEPTQRNTELAKRYAAYVDQLFTAEELEQLEVCLRARAPEVVMEEIELPVTHFEIPYAAIPPEPGAGEGYGLVELPSACGKTTFKVLGFFDVMYNNPFERYEISVVKSLIERAGLRPDPTPDAPDDDTQALYSSLSELQAALLKLQQSLDTLNRKLSNGE